jgi:uncharacterized tellurite resistance protein B-like protein
VQPLDERAEMSVELADLLVEIACALGEAAQRKLRRLQRIVEALQVGPEAQAEARLPARSCGRRAAGGARRAR